MTEVLGAARELQDLHAVEPVFRSSIRTRHDPGMLPLTYFRSDAHAGHELRAWLNVIERCQRAIAVLPLFRVRMTLVIEKLVFEPENFTLTVVRDEILDAAI